jgi:acetoin utilization protein AcuB
MKVTSIMTRKMITAGRDDSLRKVRALFIKHAAFNHVLVVEGRKLVGVISDRDLLAGEECDTIPLDKKAREIMNRMPVTVDGKAGIEEAGNLLLENNISCLPVLSSQGIVEGVVTWKDILGFYMKDKSSHKAAA